MKNSIFFFILFGFTFFSVEAQLLTVGDASEVDMNQDRLARIDQFITGYVNQGVVPGGTFLVARRGKIVYHKSFGNAKINGTSPYENTDLYRIASMTKAITTVSIMQLYEQGKIGLDDPIHHYIPAFKEMQILDTYNEEDDTYTTKPATRPITVRNLLTHTSGITYGDFNPGNIQSMYEQYDMTGVGLYHEKWTNEEFCNKLAEVPLVFEPGTRFLYGLNMDVLGRIIEVITGQGLNEYFDQNIFQPLGMTDTYFNLPESKHDRLVPIYSKDEQGKLSVVTPGGLAGNPDFPLLKDNQHYAGGGGLTCTALDYAKFIFALENNGVYDGYQLLGRKAIDVMTADQLILQNKTGGGISPIPGITFGLGFLVYDSSSEGLNSKSVGTYEWGGYFNTKFFIDPAEDLVFVGMTQIVPFGRDDFWERLYALIYGSIE